MTARLMILGGGSSQVNAIRRALMSGLHVVVADQDPTAVGVQITDEYANGDFAAVSTFDTDGITRAAREHRVDGILAVGTDQPVYRAAVASACLGLPYHIDVPTALRVTNKRAMKTALVSADIPTPAFRFINARSRSTELCDLRPPYVIKPLDSQGQRGVRLCQTAEEVAAALPNTLQFSQEDEAIVEEYYESNEITVSGWVHNGESTVVSVTDRVTMDNRPSLGVCVAHRYPSAAARPGSDTADQVARLIPRITSSLGITEGPLYAQLLVGDAGVVVNEVASRLGGAYEDEWLPTATGVDMLDHQLRAAFGERTAIPAPRSQAAVCVPLLFCHPGVIAGFRGEGFLGTTFLLPPGTTIRSIENSTQRVGYAVLSGPTIAAVNTRVDRLFDEIGVLDGSGTNLLIDARSLCRLPVAGESFNNFRSSV